MYTIIYTKSHAEFNDIPLGDFFMLYGQLHFKYSCTHAFNIQLKKTCEFKEWDEVELANVEIKVN